MTTARYDGFADWYDRAVHRPLDDLVQGFLDAGFALERFEEASEDEYPFVVALRWRR